MVIVDAQFDLCRGVIGVRPDTLDLPVTFPWGPLDFHAADLVKVLQRSGGFRRGTLEWVGPLRRSGQGCSGTGDRGPGIGARAGAGSNGVSLGF